MSNTLYNLYVSDVITLAKTLVIKSVATAEAINTSQTELGMVVADDPTTWRYYKNISGAYHSTDTMMTVTSLDSQTTINFTIATLQDNRATRKAYAYGSVYYEELVKRYPGQEMLIRGILNPVDINVAIAAADNTILNWGADLVEPVEVNLIPRLQKWTDAFFLRYSQPAYDVVEDLYRAAILATYFAHVPSTIMAIRLDNCKTEYAHSFHIWEYLESNGHLGYYRDYFTTKQAMWLYRNVKYLQMNAGKVGNQSLLIDHVMTERGLPVAWYKMIHDITDFDTSESLYPGVALRRFSLNERDVAAGGKNTHTVANMLSRESKLARDNSQEIEADDIAITDVMQSSSMNTLPTKILESAMLDSSAADVFPFADIALNEWVHKATTGFYRAKIQVTNPYTGALLSMSATEAFITWLYCINKTYGITMDLIPDVVANRVRLTPLPSFDDLREFTQEEVVGDSELQWVLESNADVGVMLSTEAFYNTLIDIHTAATNQYFMYTTHENLVARGQCEAAVQRCYGWIDCVLDPDHSSFENYFNARGWYIVDLDEIDSETLAADILKYATGQDLTNTKSVKEIQGAMIQFMSQMSSYSTQWIQTINSSTVKAINGESIRLGDDKTKLYAKEEIENPGVEVLDTRAKLHASEYIDLIGEEVIEDDIWITARGRYDLDVALEMKVKHNGYSNSGLNNPIPYMKIRKQDLTERLQVTDLMGLALYYIDPIDVDPPTDLLLGQIIQSRYLGGLYYPTEFTVVTPILNGLTLPPID